MFKKALNAGCDVFFSEPGEMESAKCRTCDDDMIIERNVNAATSSVEAMSGCKHLHDRFTCPKAGTDWHDQVIRLKDEIKKTASPSVAKIMKDDLEMLLRTRQATKMD